MTVITRSQNKKRGFTNKKMKRLAANNRSGLSNKSVTKFVKLGRGTTKAATGRKIDAKWSTKQTGKEKEKITAAMRIACASGSKIQGLCSRRCWGYNIINQDICKYLREDLKNTTLETAREMKCPACKSEVELVYRSPYRFSPTHDQTFYYPPYIEFVPVLPAYELRERLHALPGPQVIDDLAQLAILACEDIVLYYNVLDPLRGECNGRIPNHQVLALMHKVLGIIPRGLPPMGRRP